MPQENLLDSEVPLGREKAKTDLITLLKENLPLYTKPENDEDLIFSGFYELCQKYGPIFIEKSPHHLHQWAALELMLEARTRIPEVDFLFIGLIRNPMATLYSAWNRRKNVPENHQYEWVTAYTNLLKFKEKARNSLHVIRYEDMAQNIGALKKMFSFIGIPLPKDINQYFHGSSIDKWQRDTNFGFQLADKAVELAGQYGYEPNILANNTNLLWPYKRACSRFFVIYMKKIKSIIKKKQIL